MQDDPVTKLTAILDDLDRLGSEGVRRVEVRLPFLWLRMVNRFEKVYEMYGHALTEATSSTVAWGAE